MSKNKNPKEPIFKTLKMNERNRILRERIEDEQQKWETLQSFIKTIKVKKDVLKKHVHLKTFMQIIISDASNHLKDKNQSIDDYELEKESYRKMYESMYINNKSEVK